MRFFSATRRAQEYVRGREMAEWAEREATNHRAAWARRDRDSFVDATFRRAAETGERQWLGQYMTSDGPVDLYVEPERKCQT